jgi:hypothetical protein
VIFSSRNLASNAASVFTDLGRLRRLILQIIVFAWALRSSLRGQKLGDDDQDALVMDGLLPGDEIDWINGFDHVPLAMVDQMRIEIKHEISAQMRANHGAIEGHVRAPRAPHHAHRPPHTASRATRWCVSACSGISSRVVRLRLQWDLIVGDDIRALLQAMTGCERINSTPMPFNYLTILRIFMVAWVLTYPVFIIGSFGWTAVRLTRLGPWCLALAARPWCLVLAARAWCLVLAARPWLLAQPSLQKDPRLAPL